jgi:hypothetical protein
MIAPTQKPTNRGTRLGADWRPDDAGMSFAVERIGAGAANVELDKFRDYWTARTGAGATKADWGATWRNWVRTAAERRRPAARDGPGYGRAFRTNDFLEAAIESQDDADKARSIINTMD